MIPKDLKVKVGTALEAEWIKVKEATEARILSGIINNKADEHLLELANKMIKEEEDGRKLAE